MVSPITINNIPIEFSSSAEHVGIIRSSEGNLPHLLGRISSHRKALFSVIPAGLSKRNNANPSATLRVEKTFALPVLISGVASLVPSLP